MMKCFCTNYEICDLCLAEVLEAIWERPVTLEEVRNFRTEVKDGQEVRVWEAEDD